MARGVRTVRALFCPYCDKEIRSTARICPACRSSLGVGSPSPEEVGPSQVGRRASQPARRSRFGRMGFALLPVVLVLALMGVMRWTSGVETNLPLGGFVAVLILILVTFLLLRRR